MLRRRRVTSTPAGAAVRRMSMNEIKRYLVSEKKYNITPAVNKMQAPLVQEVFHQMGEMVLYPDHLAALAAKDAEWKKWAEVELAANDEKWQKVLAQSISTSNANVAAAQDEIERLSRALTLFYDKWEN